MCNICFTFRNVLGKTEYCLHSGDCAHNATAGFIQTLIGAAGLKIGAEVLTSLLRKKSPKFITKDTAKFSCFLATLVGIFKLVNCLLRILRGREDWLNSFLAGSLAGVASLSIDEKQRRQTIAMYIATRTLQYFCRFLVSKGYLPNFQYMDVVLMCLVSSIILNALLTKLYSLPKQYKRFLIEHGGFSYIPNIDDLLIQFGNISRNEPVDESKLPNVKYPKENLGCRIQHHSGDRCVPEAIRYFPLSLYRSVKLYLPLNLITSILFRGKTLIKSPVSLLVHILKSTTRSSLFLSSYCTIGFTFLCVLRYVFGRESWWFYYLNGVLSGSMVLIEVKQRRMELAMYVLPRAIETVWNQLRENRMVQPIQYADFIYFSIAMGTLLSLYQNSPKSIHSSFLKILRSIFGTN